MSALETVVKIRVDLFRDKVPIKAIMWKQWISWNSAGRRSGKSRLRFDPQVRGGLPRAASVSPRSAGLAAPQRTQCLLPLLQPGFVHRKPPRCSNS